MFFYVVYVYVLGMFNFGNIVIKLLVIMVCWIFFVFYFGILKYNIENMNDIINICLFLF